MQVKIINLPKILEIQKFNQKVYADDKIKNYVAEIVDATRNPKDYDINVDGYIE